MLSVYLGSLRGEQIVYQHGLDGEHVGEVRVTVDESTDQLEVVAMLVRIASLIEREEKTRRGDKPATGMLGPRLVPPGEKGE